MAAWKWSGPVARYAPALTGDNRRLAVGGIDHRQLPLPVRYAADGGHAGAVDIGGITGLDVTQDPIVANGFYLPASVEPQVTPAMYKMLMGINGMSLDLEPGSMKMAVTEENDDAGEARRVLDINNATIMAITQVSTPAFANTRVDISMGPDSTIPMPMALIAAAAEQGFTFEEVDDSWAIEQMALVAATVAEYAVKSSWDLPIAKGDPGWDAGAARAALDSWAGDDMGKYASAFLYKDASADPKLKGSYKFPIAMPVSGKLTIIPAAVRAAASRVSGADIPSADKAAMQRVIHTLMMRISPAASEISEGLVAGGGPLAPTNRVFFDPMLDKPTPVQVTPDGRVFGHIALWNVCHTGVGNKCVLAPHSKLDYEKFHQGTVITSEGEALRVGKITLGAGHADVRLGMLPAVEHYDNSATAVAVVRAGEDRFGIWFAGSLLPGVSAERCAELRRSPLSGDWRYDDKVDNLELIAALAVNSPGFPIYGMVAGAQISLCAAGMVIDLTQFDVVDADEAKAAEERKERLAAFIAADEVREQAKRAERLVELVGEEK